MSTPGSVNRWASTRWCGKLTRVWSSLLDVATIFPHWRMLRAIPFPILQGARCLQKLVWATGKYPAPMSLFIRVIDAFRARNIRNNNNTKMILREVKRSCFKISVFDYRIKILKKKKNEFYTINLLIPVTFSEERFLVTLLNTKSIVNG